MLTFSGQGPRLCDGVTRRSFLRVGALTAGGLTMADLLRADAVAGGAQRKKSIINIYLSGGPSHLDMFDLKPTAPIEFRGEFNPIQTNVPGMDICEHMPALAKMADKFAVIRSVTGVRDEHNPSQSDSGWSEQSLRILGGRPGIGAVVSKVHGTVNGTAPTSVSLSNFGRYGYLGPAYRPYEANGQGRNDLTLNSQVSLDRLGDRKNLLSGLDRMRRDIDRSQMMEALDQFNERAVTVITSGELGRSLDTRNVDAKTADAYGYNRGGSFGGNRNFLLAKRLIESGVRVVGLSWGGWDTHSDNFNSLRRQLPALDVGLAALITDLEQSGLLQDTIIMMSGEFGRTPRVNASAGRDHWSRASSWFLAGGGLTTGQVIGSTNHLGEYAQDRPVDLQQIYSTIYRQLGVDPGIKLEDPAGRPQYIMENRELITELL